jgi:hypothetical protein
MLDISTKKGFQKNYKITVSKNFVMSVGFNTGKKSCSAGEKQKEEWLMSNRNGVSSDSFCENLNEKYRNKKLEQFELGEERTERNDKAINGIIKR